MYTGGNRFVSASKVDLMNPKIIPAIMCPVGVSSGGVMISGIYCVLYYRDFLFLYDMQTHTVASMADVRTYDKIVKAASDGKIMFSANSNEYVISGISVANSDYFDVI